MSDKRNASLIFKSWKHDLKSKDRSMKNTRSNFSELVYSFYAASIPADIAMEYLKPAVKEHMFTEEIAKRTWKRVQKRYSTYKVWIDKWKEAIEDAANSAFIEYYSPVDNSVNQIDSTVITVLDKEDDSLADDDVLNEQQFYSKTKKVSKDNPWLFKKEDCS